MSTKNNAKKPYTDKQGQYLAFIYNYTRIHGRPPAQADFQRYFNVSAPTIHQMILQLEKKCFITRCVNTPRSITLAIADDQVPPLR